MLSLLRDSIRFNKTFKSPRGPFVQGSPCTPENIRGPFVQGSPETNEKMYS